MPDATNNARNQAAAAMATAPRNLASGNLASGAGPRPLVDVLLALAFRRQITAPDAESGIAILRAEAGTEATEAAWHEAVASAVRDGLIHDPVRLPPGALQCHWRIELTPAGVAAVRPAAQAGSQPCG